MLPGPERPRERLERDGDMALSTEELIALVLGSGVAGAPVIDVARRLLHGRGGVVGLSRCRVRELCAEPGIGAARAARLVAAFALGRRAMAAQPAVYPQVCGPADVDRLLRPQLANLEIEVFWALALDVKNRVVDRCEIGRGSLTSVDVHPREVFRFLTTARAAAGVMVHNHPSGDPRPSTEDVELTHRLVLAGQLLGIPIIDHVVIAAGGYASVLDHGPPISADPDD